ncbi:MAG TPA: glycosyltransferase family A protein [Cytophagaceae bacterium]|jgi:glycosyltransferase involved in cell wall biosynthesis|nr:glycosyltransferase family A protein [Cytophagaceae bacterium]
MTVENLSTEHIYDYQSVAAIVTAMTNDEARFLPEALKSVIADPDIGQIILCVEDKNNWLDAALGVLKNESRLKIISLPIMPIGSIRNKALEHVRKPWVAYCDGDDVWCAGKTSIQLNYAYQTGADFVGAAHYLTDAEGIIGAYGLSLYLPMTSSWLVRTEIMRQYPFNESMHQSSDGEWWIRTARLFRKVKCPSVLVRYRVRSSSVSASTPSKKRKHIIILFSKIPLVGKSIYFLTYCLWLYTRTQPYRWKSVWGKKGFPKYISLF